MVRARPVALKLGGAASGEAQGQAEQQPGDQRQAGDAYERGGPIGSGRLGVGVFAGAAEGVSGALPRPGAG